MVGIGGFFGALTRFVVSKNMPKPAGIPFGTFAVNIIGAFLLGLLVGLQLHGYLYTLFGIGFMGAFTTFSTFMLESEQLRERKKTSIFYSYFILSCLIGFVALIGGLWLGARI
ncbi:fluoride efflux transporter FluC [Bacillus rubiinfantis]|uniref:fluoride efflux transporter FluC n=1 Tax=Bacillus rubiinfantis TaxID=1499680 RepID=UPI001FEACE23|nr:CrcB family protein [Bacillus rubiinfantis]